MFVVTISGILKTGVRQSRQNIQQWFVENFEESETGKEMTYFSEIETFSFTFFDMGKDEISEVFEKN